MTEPLLRDGLDELGRDLFAAADDERPSEGSHATLLATVLGAAAGTAAAAGALGAGVTGVGAKSAVTSAGSLLVAAKWIALGATVAGAAWVGAATLAHDPRSDAAPKPAVIPAPVATSAGAPASTIVETPSTPVVDVNALPTAEPKPAAKIGAPDKRNAIARDQPSSVPAAEEPREVTEPPTAPRGPTLGDQVRVLDRARARLRAGDRAGALEALAEFDRRFERTSPLAPEATQIRAAAALLQEK